MSEEQFTHSTERSALTMGAVSLLGLVLLKEGGMTSPTIARVPPTGLSAERSSMEMGDALQGHP